MEGKVICLALSTLSARYFPELLSKILTRQPGFVMQVRAGDKDSLRQHFSDGTSVPRVHGKNAGECIKPWI